MLRTAQDSVHLIAATIGFVSYAALWAGTLWGTVLRSGWATSRLRHQTVHSVHMHVILLGLTLGIVHGIVQMAAPYGKVRAIDVVVPFIDRADPIGVGLGVAALELMIATALSVLVQRRIGYARWRALHSLGYLSFTMVAAHLLISGSELYPAPVRTAIAASWAVVILAGISTVTHIARLPRAIFDRLSPRHRAEEVTVAVDPGKCGSFGFCEQEAPAIFTLRSDQRLAYRSVVPSDQAEAAMRAAVVCPARAIKLGRLPATVVVSQPGADTTTVAPLATTLTPHTGTQPAVDTHADPHAGSLARMAAAVDQGTGSHPRPAMTDSGSFAPVGTGPQPRVPASDTGSFPRVGAQPRVTDSGSFPRVGTGPAADPRSYPPAAVGQHTGPQPGLRPVGVNGHARPPAVNGHGSPLPAVGAHTGSLPPVGSVPTNGHTGPQPALPPVGPVPANGHTGPQPALRPVGPVPANGHTGPQPALRPVAGPARAPQPGLRSVGRRAAADPPPEDALPAPDQLQDTGRHHLPRLRGIAGGRS
ncbi:MAG TPA: ferredoxin [Mycobacteriales bacterium]